MTDSPTPRPDPQPIRAVWNQLRAPDFRLLDHLAFLSRLTAQRSPARATYCTPGRAWLAQQLGCSVRTVSRATARLAALGVLSKTQRRPRAGRWQTNLYRIIGPAGWRAAAFCNQLRRLTHRLSRPAHLASRSTTENGSQRPKESLRDVIRRGLLKFTPG